jgi:anti-sigma factor RsiW
MLTEIEETLADVPLAATTALALRESAAALRRALDSWKADPPPAAELVDLAQGISDVRYRTYAYRKAYGR